MTPAAPHREILAGKRVAITGLFAAMSQRELARLIEQSGGQVLDTPSRNTDWLVVGGHARPLDELAAPTRRLRRARRLQAAGYPVEILTEDAFLERLGLDRPPGALARCYTLGQMSGILGVPRRRLQAWIRRGLIEPAEVVHRLAYFDYQQLSRARTLQELTGAGVTLRQITASRDRLQRWLDEPAVLDALSSVAMPCLAVRLADGRLVEVTGQYRLDFPESTDEVLRVPPQRRTADEWFDTAVLLEDEDRMAEAAASYQEAIRQDGTDPVLHFNLANTLYGLARLTEAVGHYRRATELDPAYLEAWNNYGLVLAELGRVDEALAAFRQALARWPGYTDARQNLAALLERLGRPEEAREHLARHQAAALARRGSAWTLHHDPARKSDQ